MLFEICSMKAEDSREVLKMMRDFYDSPAILHKADDEILKQDIADCVSENPFVEGFVFKSGNNILGYSMLAKSYSTEYGCECIWIEDLYIKPEYRSNGIATSFFKYIDNLYKSNAVRLRLEVEPGNKNAIEVYKKNGYNELNYIQMVKEPNN